MAIAEAMSAAAQDMRRSRFLRRGRSSRSRRGRPRLFALDLEDSDGACVRLQQAVSDALEAERFYKPEKRPFWPHVTLARVKRNQRAEPLPADPPPLEPFRATAGDALPLDTAPAGGAVRAARGGPL